MNPCRATPGFPGGRPAFSKVRRRNSSRVHSHSTATWGRSSPDATPSSFTKRPWVPTTISSGRMGVMGERTETSTRSPGTSSDWTGGKRESRTAAAAAMSRTDSQRGR